MAAVVETSGHSAAELALDQAIAKTDEIYEQILAHVPTTSEGMKAIAMGILLCDGLNRSKCRMGIRPIGELRGSYR
jgi:hypothetical protein